MVRRFHSDPRVQATELLLQERVPRERGHPEARARPRRPHVPASRGAAVHPPLPLATHRAAARPLPLERGLHRDRDQRRRRRIPLAGPRRDPGARGRHARPRGLFLYLRDVRSGATWSATYQPDAHRSPSDYVVELSPPQGLLPPARGRRRDAARDRGLARRRRRGSAAPLTNRSAREREIEVTSYGEIVLGLSRRGPRPSGVRQALRGDLLRARQPCPPLRATAARGRRTHPLFAIHVLSVEGRLTGAVEWETDRARFLGRGREAGRSRGARRPSALRDHGGGPRSDREPAPSPSALAREARPALASRPGLPTAGPARWPSPRSTTTPRASSRAFALAYTHAQMALRHLGITSEDAQLFERLASRVLYVDGSLRVDARGPGRQRSRPVGPLGPRHLRRPSHPARARGRGGRPAPRAPVAPGPGVLAAQGSLRGRRDPERAPRELSGRDARAPDQPLESGPWAAHERAAGRRLPPARRGDTGAGARGPGSAWRAGS